MGLYMQKALSEWISIFVAMIESTLHPWLGVSFSRRASFMHLGCRLPRRERVSVPSFLPTLRSFVAELHPKSWTKNQRSTVLL